MNMDYWSYKIKKGSIKTARGNPTLRLVLISDSLQI